MSNESPPKRNTFLMVGFGVGIVAIILCLIVGMWGTFGGSEYPYQTQVAGISRTATRPSPALSPTPTVLNMNAFLSEAIDMLSPGMMVFNPPEKMKQASTARVELRIAPVALGEETPMAATLSEGLRGPGAPQAEPIKVGTVMKAKLNGDGFEVTLLSEEEQFVSDDTYTEWAWNVKPLQSGERDLNLTVTVKVIAEGLGERARDIPVITRKIIVDVDPVYTVTSFVGDNWQWLWAAILVPAAGWGVAYYSKKRAERKRQSEQSRQHFE